MMKKPMVPQYALTACLALVISSGSLAQTDPKSGQFDYTSCFNTSVTFENVGVNRSATPGGLFDNDNIRCFGTWTSLDGKSEGRWTCQESDQSGATRVISYTSDGKSPPVRTLVSATGKYQGMTESSVTLTPAFPPLIRAESGQACNRQTGSFSLK
jgi:hypothetical protein